FYEGGVGEARPDPVFVLQYGANGQDCAAQVSQNDDPVTPVGLRDCPLDQVSGGAQPTVGSAAGGFDPHLAAGHLAGELGEASRQFGAVRHQYNPDQTPPSRNPGSMLGSSLHYGHGFGNAE